MVDVPYTFTAGTTAKANEVNANFKSLEDGVNNSLSSISNIESALDALEENKADINGSPSNQFYVGNATEPKHAINKEILQLYIGNFIGYQYGLIITKDPSNPNDTIIVSTGSCYDSTNTVMLVLNSPVSKQNSSQSPTSTYYVYIVGNGDGSNTDIVISQDQTSPPLPSGYTYYRNIGKYVTDGNGNIMSIYNNGTTTSDGEWVSANVTLSTAKSAGTYTIDVSEHLPDDNYSYDLLLNHLIDSDGSVTHTFISSSIITNEMQIGYVEGSSDASTDTFILPVGQDRILTYKITGSTADDSVWLKLYGYRRLGTNG